MAALRDICSYLLSVRRLQSCAIFAPESRGSSGRFREDQAGSLYDAKWPRAVLRSHAVTGHSTSQFDPERSFASSEAVIWQGIGNRAAAEFTRGPSG